MGQRWPPRYHNWTFSGPLGADTGLACHLWAAGGSQVSSPQAAYKSGQRARSGEAAIGSRNPNGNPPSNPPLCHCNIPVAHRCSPPQGRPNCRDLLEACLCNISRNHIRKFYAFTKWVSKYLMFQCIYVYYVIICI